MSENEEEGDSMVLHKCLATCMQEYIETQTYWCSIVSCTWLSTSNSSAWLGIRWISGKDDNSAFQCRIKPTADCLPACPAK